MTLTVGFDSETLGQYRLRGGKIEVVAATDGARAALDDRLEHYARLMVEVGGYDPDAITAGQLLHYVAAHAASGRNWATLSAD